MEFLRSKQMTALIVMATILLLVLAVKGLKELSYVGAGVYPANVITVNGEGEVFAVPDVAQFTFTVESEAGTMEAAQEANAEKINDIIAYLEDEADIEERDIKTSSYNSYPRYEWQSEVTEIDGGVEYLVREGNTRVLVGYVVTQSVSVKVRDTEEAGEVIAEVSGRGATNVSGLNFTIDDQSKLEMEAREAAIKDAREKAKVLADQLDVKLVGVVNFYENEGYGYGYGGDRMMAMDAAESAPVAPELPVGENEIRSNVSVTFEIR